MIILDWDENKRKTNLIKRKIDFADLQELFENETAQGVDDRFDYGEDRLLTFGLFAGIVLAVVHTETDLDDDVIVRIISARRANKNEQEYYFKNIRD
ncbi:MAG: BrnT family toxin [Pyrinomonadaceae bacterium]